MVLIKRKQSTKPLRKIKTTSRIAIHIHGLTDMLCKRITSTSLNAYPAAGLAHYVKAGTPIFLIDPDDVPKANIPNLTHIQKGASEGMKLLMERL